MIERVDMELKGKPQQTVGLGLVDPSSYYAISDVATDHMDVHLADDIRLLAFANAFVGMPDVKVQALGRESGEEWQGPFDWTPRKWNILCRDQAENHFENIIVLVTNSNWEEQLNSDGPLLFVGSNLGCAGWQGTSEWRLQGESHNAQSELSYTLAANAQITFGLTTSRVTGDAVTFEFQPVAGSVNWSHVIDGRDLQTGQTIHCARSGVKPLSDISGMLMVGEKLGGAAPDRQFFGAGVAHLNPADLCPDTAELGWTNQAWLATGDRKPWEGHDGGRLRGSDSETVTDEGSSSTTTSVWDFTALSGSQ
jgi:hypothetical protein